MSAPIFRTPGSRSLAGEAVAQPVSAGGDGLHWANEAGFLLGRALPPVVSTIFPPPTLPGSVLLPYNVAFQRSPGCQVVRAELEFQVGASSTPPPTRLNVTCAAGTLQFIGTNADFFNGTRDIQTETGALWNFQRLVGSIDVTALPVGSITDLTFTLAGPKDSAGGLYRLHVTEVPVATTAVASSPTLEIGVDGAWPNVANPLVDGTPTAKRGFLRLLKEIERARTQVPAYLQLLRPEVATHAFQATTVATSFGSVFSGLGNEPKFRFRVRNTYGQGASTTYTFRCRYATSSTNTGKVRVEATDVGTSTTTNTDITLATTGGATTWSTATGTVTFPTNLSGNPTLEFDVRFRGQTSTAATTVYLSQLALIRNDP